MNLLRKIQTYIPEKNQDEIYLQAQGKDFEPNVTWEELNHTYLEKLTKDKDIYFSSSVFYNKLVYQSNSSKFIKEIDSIPIEPNNLPKIPGKLWVIPASFYRDIPEFDGEGRLIRDIAERFGLKTELIEVNTKGSISENAKFLSEKLRQVKDSPLHIISISKGSSDLKLALVNNPELQEKIYSWVSVGGIFSGTPLADHFLNRNRFAYLLQSGVLKLLGIPSEYLGEFSHKNGIFSNKKLIPGKNRIALIGIPLPSQMHGNLLKRYKILSKYGPNDGFTLCLDSSLPDSRIYPLWGADHYFRSIQVSSVIYKVFYYLSKQLFF